MCPLSVSKTWFFGYAAAYAELGSFQVVDEFAVGTVEVFAVFFADTTACALSVSFRARRLTSLSSIAWLLCVIFSEGYVR